MQKKRMFFINAFWILLAVMLFGVGHNTYAFSKPTVTTISASPGTTCVTYYGRLDSAGGWTVASAGFSGAYGCGAGNVNTGNNYSCTVCGLSSGTTYTYKAMATNSMGTSYGATLSFTTQGPPSVTTEAVTSITSTTAVGNGNITNTGGINPTRYIEWSTNSNGPFGYSCSAGVGGAGAYSCNMTGLQPGTTYYVRARADNSAGQRFGTPTSFTTPGTLATISTVSSSNITEYTATLTASVTAIGAEDPTRAIQITSTSGNYTNASECTVGTGGTGQYSCQISNLIPNTTYYYRAKATNSAGTSYGSEMSFTTIALQDTTITDPDPTKIQNKVSEGYFQLNQGTITATDSVTTTVNITVQDGIFHATFPQNTEITESTNQSFNFQNFTASNVTTTVREGQPTSRAAVKIGVPGESLSFSQDVTLTVTVGQAFNGQTLDILYQNDGEVTWHTQGTCTITNGQCSFQTNHATIYTINGEHKATGDTPMNLNVQVQETLSMDCFDPSDNNTTVSLGTLANPGMITAGTPAVGQSRCTVTTNADQGYYLTVENSNPIHATLTHTDPNTGTLYEISDVSAWDETTKTTSTWNAPTTKGLGFSVIAFPEADTTHNQFDGVWTETGNCPEGTNSDTNDYAGIPPTPQTISAVTSYQQNATTTDICYKVDVPPSQPSGQYSGQVTFTATSDASGYWE